MRPTRVSSSLTAAGKAIWTNQCVLTDTSKPIAGMATSDRPWRKSSRVACGNYSICVEYIVRPLRQRRTVLPKRYSGPRLKFRVSCWCTGPIVCVPAKQGTVICKATNTILLPTHRSNLFFQLSRHPWHRRVSLMEHGFDDQRVDALLGPMH